MTGKALFKIERVDHEGFVLFRVSGHISESLGEDDFMVPPSTASADVVIDLSDAQRINSVGVRAWMRSLAKLKQSRVWFIGVRPALIMQFNTVYRFGGNGTILSLYAPYTCGNCPSQPEVLLPVMRHYGTLASHQAPESRCADCGALLEFDELPDDYFECVSSSPRPEPPSAVGALFEPTSGPKRPSLKVTTDVRDTFTAVWLSGHLAGRTKLEKVASTLSGRVLVVLGGLQGVDQVGLEALRSLLALPQLEVHVARVPIHLFARALPGSPSDGGRRASLRASLGPAPICSLLVKASCRRCGDVSIELVSAARLLREQPCPKCRSALQITVEDGLRGEIVGQTEMTAYLEQHLHGPPVHGSKVRSHLQIIADRYELMTKIGSGGMAEVFLARQRGAGGFEKRVVIKRLLPHLAENGDFVQMFLQEARLAGRITHPNVVEIFDIGKDGDHYFIAMEFVHGWDLNQIWHEVRSRGTAFPIPIALRFIVDIAAGLAAAHRAVDERGAAAPIMHRDATPHNILVSVDGAVKLADFGLAKAQDTRGITKTGQLKGKIAYMAPEQIEGKTEPASDVFAVGVIAYMLLTNTQPFQRASEVHSLQAVLMHAAPDVRTLRSEIPDRLAELVARAIDKNPRARFQDGGDLYAALTAYMAQEGMNPTQEELVQFLLNVPLTSSRVADLTPSGATDEMIPTAESTQVTDPTDATGTPSSEMTAVELKSSAPGFARDRKGDL